ncbi:MAG: response regulator transcription factor [Deltaproteobacteria bacterium]|nr:response regulator transcription factor [Deltaproteobacteria bacterium]
MTILLGSANKSVITRWEGLLGGQYPLEQATLLRELKRLCAEKNFDLILLHRSLIDMDGFAELRKASPLCKFFLLSDQPNEDEGIAFLKLGIVGYGNTYISQARLTEAVRVINGGAVWLGQKVIQQLILESYSRAKEQPAPQTGRTSAGQKLAGLTPAEHKVAELVARGQSNLEIAYNLRITERTVKAHLTSVYEKTKTGSRLSLAMLINRG